MKKTSTFQNGLIWFGAGVSLAEILTGKVNPSGSLVDTYCYDNFSAPAMWNFTPTTYEGYVEGGDVPAANAMLGMPYAIRFAVQHGAGLGRTLGVPTINQIYPAGFQMPRYGIYITRTRIGDTWYPSATGLGTRPTVNSDETKVTCETFIPDFSGDLYGTDPVVEFHAYLSPSKKFDTLDELRACINNAAKRAQEYFA